MLILESGIPIEGIPIEGVPMIDLRSKVIRLASEKPELKQHLMPLLKQGGLRYPLGWYEVVKYCSLGAGAWSLSLHQGDIVQVHPDKTMSRYNVHDNKLDVVESMVGAGNGKLRPFSFVWEHYADEKNVSSFEKSSIPLSPAEAKDKINLLKSNKKKGVYTLMEARKILDNRSLDHSTRVLLKILP